MAYDAQQKALAIRIQRDYRNAVADAWAEEAEAAKRRHKAIVEAERRRNERLDDAGIKINDIRDLTNDH